MLVFTEDEIWLPCASNKRVEHKGQITLLHLLVLILKRSKKVTNCIVCWFTFWNCSNQPYWNFSSWTHFIMFFLEYSSVNTLDTHWNVCLGYLSNPGCDHRCIYVYGYDGRGYDRTGTTHSCPMLATASAHQHPYLHAHTHTWICTHKQTHNWLHKLLQSWNHLFKWIKLVHQRCLIE